MKDILGAQLLIWKVRKFITRQKNEEENVVKAMKDTLLILCLIKNRKHMCQCTCYECHDNVPVKAALVIRKSSASEKFELGKIFKQSTQKHFESLFIKL